MPAAGKKLHHFVPRFYLKSWAREGLVYCLRAGTIFQSNLRNIASENHFYKLRELSPEDVEFIRALVINGSPASLRESHEELVQAFALPHFMRKQLERSGSANFDLMEIDRIIAELNENYHTSIEEVFKPFLDSLLASDVSFLEEPRKAAMFYWSLAVQYLRTNHAKNIKRIMQPDRAAYYLKLANVIVHLHAKNLGFSMYARRRQYTVILIANLTELPFITADQPVINIAANPDGIDPPDRFELYYPLSPTKALLLLEPSSNFLPPDPIVSAAFAHFCNLRMAAHSYQQIFSNNPEELIAIKNELPAFLRRL